MFQPAVITLSCRAVKFKRIKFLIYYVHLKKQYFHARKDTHINTRVTSAGFIRKIYAFEELYYMRILQVRSVARKRVEDILTVAAVKAAW